MSSDDLPGPLRHFLTRLDEMRSGSRLDMDKAGRLLVELAADEEYLGPLIAEIPSESPGGTWLVKPERGPPPGAVPPARGGDGLHPLPPLLGRNRSGPRRGDPSAVGCSSP